MNWRAMITLALLLGAIASGWSVWTQRRKEAEPTASVARSDYVLIDFELTALNPQGKESFTLRAPRLVRDPKDKTMDIATPLFLIPPSEGTGNDAWEVRARNGWVNEGGDELRLRDNVTGTSSGVKGSPTQLTTQELNVYPDKRKARSPNKVVITQPGSILSGRGLELDLGTKQYSFQSEVRHRYVPTAR